MAVSVASASDVDRLSFTLFLALALHAILVLGVSFSKEDPKPAPHTMAITLAQHDDKEKPEKADFLAQANQKGSGTAREAVELTAVEKTDFKSPEPKPVAEVVTPPPAPNDEPVRSKPVVTATAFAQSKVPEPVKAVKEVVPEEPVQPRKSIMQRSLEIASLEARLAEQEQSYSNRPRITRLTASSTMSVVDAYYIQNWQKKIERVGNLNYPEEARQRKIYGKPRLLIALWPNGTIKEIRVLESSGHKLLDDAAVRIVRLASPFLPFPKEVRDERDILEIIRTFSFQPKGLSSS
ncbi:MAG: energy transducer TonB [Hahellaceae bacterium]|nr:energy transducer TonB [Hahellaceae bacterium]MCP5169319.1 energy transducer TonB [Hahellaceae bacterium]